MKFKTLFTLLCAFLLLLVVAVPGQTLNRTTLMNGFDVVSIAGTIVPGDTLQYTDAFSLPLPRVFNQTDSIKLATWYDFNCSEYLTTDITFAVTLQGSTYDIPDTDTSRTWIDVSTVFSGAVTDSTNIKELTYLADGKDIPYSVYRLKVAATGVGVATPDTSAYFFEIW